jgi:hypothetical protein
MNTYRTVERCIRRYTATGLYIAVVSRFDHSATCGTRTYCRAGLRTIHDARAARADLEKLHPPRRKLPPRPRRS